MRSVRAIALFLLTLAACSKTQVAATPPPIRNPIGQLRCAVDAECEVQTPVCERERHVCVCTVTTNSDGTVTDSCATQHCNPFTGQCVAELPGCAVDGDCATDFYCDAPVRTCKKRSTYCEPCESDLACGGARDFCIGHPDFPATPRFCSKACDSDSDCPPLNGCQDIAALGKKQCVPSFGTCENVAGCIADLWASCGSTPDCNDQSQVCDLGQHACVAAVQVCHPPEQVCDPHTRQCIAACTSDQACGRGYRCDHGLCIALGACDSDSDCPGGQVCLLDGASDGSCIEGCSTVSPCPLGQVCVNDGTRNHCLTSCAVDSDCPLNSVCSSATTPATCTPPSAGRCQITDVCAGCYSCNPVSKTCEKASSAHCSPHDGSNCNPNAANPCGSGFTCLNFGAPDNARCYGVCNDLRCPAGFVCTPVSWTVCGIFGCGPATCNTDNNCKQLNTNALCTDNVCVVNSCVPASRSCGTLCAP